MLNLNGSLTKAGVKYSTLWSDNFDDEYFLDGLARWLKTGVTRHRTPHVQAFARARVPAKARAVAGKIATDLRTPVQFVVDTPAGVDGVQITASSPVRLFRVSGFTAAPQSAGSDGPFLTDTASFCG